MSDSVTPADSAYPRDLKGYGGNPPHARWPGGARIAVQFVLNYEEGAENSVLHGDPTSETFLSEIVGAQAFEARHMSMESMYEYGSRVGSGACCASSTSVACRSPCSGWRWLCSATPRWCKPSWIVATRLPVTAGAGSTTST